jgi:ATP-binding cassette, subfamily C, bacterial PrsD
MARGNAAELEGGSARSEFAAALTACAGALAGVALISGVSNVLMLTGSFFMLETYDRVLPSRSVSTLIGLSVLALGLYVFQGTLDLIRSRILVRVAAFLDESLSTRIYHAVVKLPLTARGSGDGLQPLRDFDHVRGFLTGSGPLALFDLPWMPLFLGMCFLFHFWIGLAALVGALTLVGLTLVTEFLTRRPTRDASTASSARQALVQAGRRNAEVLKAMGMAGRTGVLWAEANRKFRTANGRTSDVAGDLGALSRVLRMLLQSTVLGVGAYLVIQQESTAGIIIAASILTARALSPVDIAIANWKGFVAARQGWQRLNSLLALLPDDDTQMELPAPKRQLTVKGVGLMPPGVERVVVQDVTFALQAGHGLGIVGMSGSGKSSLARALVGVWAPVRGKIRLDGAALEQWLPEALGQHIGYLPQDVELLDGTVEQNIARFTDADLDEVIAAATAAQVHEKILSLPQGYRTRIGESGANLPAGLRQRVALARALFRDPFLVVLDEPNSNLDAEGDQALTQAMLNVRARGGIVIVVAHRPSALAGVDHVLVMHEGRPQAFGARDQVLQQQMLVGGNRSAGSMAGPLPAIAAAPARGTPLGTIIPAKSAAVQQRKRDATER